VTYDNRLGHTATARERSEVSRREKGLASVSDDISRFRTWIAPHVCADGVKLGDKPIAAVTRRDLESFVEALDRNVQRGEGARNFSSDFLLPNGW